MKLLQNSTAGVVMVILGALGLGFDFVAMLGLEGLPAQIIQALESIILVMGFRDLMLEEKQKMLTAVADFKSKSFIGTLIVMVQPIFLTPEVIPGISDQLSGLLLMLGNLLAAVGLIDAGKRGKFGNGRSVV